jgi:hypothetical protein
MELKEYIKDRLAELEDFQADYERKARKKGQTMFRPEDQWAELFSEFMERYSVNQDDQSQEAA